MGVVLVQCPVCGYEMHDFDVECKRCLAMAAQRAAAKAQPQPMQQPATECPACRYPLDANGRCRRCDMLAKADAAQADEPVSFRVSGASPQRYSPSQQQTSAWTWNKPSPAAGLGYFLIVLSVLLLPIVFVPLAFIAGIVAIAAHQDRKNGIVLLVISVLYGAYVLVAIGVAVLNAGPGGASTPSAVSLPQRAALTMAAFERIQIGMSEEEVARVVGSPGSITEERATFSGGIGRTRVWEDGTGRAIAVVFADGQAISKEQAGL